ncbi:MAG: cytochrome-c peroxidase [Gammaproteobacteria bacterium]|nr:cytochrome-c peroxidase [Gammaproteobacteria bacterium]
MRLRTPILALLLLPAAHAAAPRGDAVEWTLNDVCPAGFALEDGGCRLRSLYRGLDSLQGAGVGGPQTGLPPLREGFSPQQIDLGRLLFFDPVLSVDGSLACASCHDPERGFADGLALSPGVNGLQTGRSTPSLWNVGFLKRLTCAGRAPTLEQPAQGPLFAANEMGNSPERLAESLNAIPAYRTLFRQVYGGDGTIRAEQVYAALAAFQSTLVSLNSRYDLYAAGFHEALNEREIEGMNVFRSFVARCAECHTPPLFTNQQIAVIGTPEPEGRAFDPGAQKIGGDASQRGGFKVPSLRNIARTAPYMHSGRFKTLREAVAFYNGGRGHAVPPGEKLSLHWHIWEPKLAEREIDRLVDFLQTLTDERYTPQIPARVPSGLAPGGGGLPQETTGGPAQGATAAAAYRTRIEEN